MKPLSETNPYLRDAQARKRMLEENARQSSIFEGARGLPKPDSQPPLRKRRSTAAAKKPVSGS